MHGSSITEHGACNAPSARSTYDGSKEADAQADPEETAICFIAMSRLSPYGAAATVAAYKYTTSVHNIRHT